ncbi:hypothetical protein E1265_23665 [Streptomyces sp. 8K308]|uniref:hypothetical protein n=1 Tax=Streptomyces sp. 8K308 TaxID=2530388 RepID=UPI0010536495|nr:hypothetical protein [Streptomyces sp. 8K308]TDC19593.1 hypothetical protein E1265_23665 [Streptomyces sp. 8K308]
MVHWWTRNIVDPGKLPLLLALVAFVVTFLVTRCITRLIRAGRGPFHDVSAGGQHVHHVVPGVVLMLAGGFGAVAAGTESWVGAVTAVVFGIGAGLVLDEFALILYLHDVYWSEQGRRSVEAVVLTAAVAGMLLTGFLPLGIDQTGPEERLIRLNLVTTVLGTLALVAVVVLKGKYVLAVFGVLLPPVALVGALRLARPESRWARWLYRKRPRLAARAERRARRHDARWNRVGRRLGNILAGPPNPPNPPNRANPQNGPKPPGEER